MCPCLVLMAEVEAPWSQDQVAALARWQDAPWVHPFTCGGLHHGDSPPLLPMPDGWVCPKLGCGYLQNWAHDFMLSGPPPNPFPRL